MSKRLEVLSKSLQRVEGSIETEKRRLRRSCAHRDILYCDANVGYLFMCARCFTENHGWTSSPFPYRGPLSEMQRVSRGSFFDRRPPGELFMVGDDE